MSKAFDTVDRGTLFEDLKDILNNDELHMISILLNDVKLSVKCGKVTGENFNTNVGVPQGDCLSPVLFTLYLAKALAKEKQQLQHHSVFTDHAYAKTPEDGLLPLHLQDHDYSNYQDHTFIIDQQYADDIGWVTNSKYRTDKIKTEIPEKLKKRNLQVNNGKTEEFSIKRNGTDDWKKCKYLGSLLNTTDDITRRKQLALAAFTQYKGILTSDLPMKTRIRIFNAYITSVFLYNSELWTLTKSQESSIDILQRKLLRRILKIHWPYTIKNEELYQRTDEQKWSEKIRRRRLKWLGHMLRLPELSPAQQALQEALRPVKRPRGRPKNTWIQLINKDLKQADLKLGSSKLIDAVSDREVWNDLIEGVCAEPTNGETA